MEPKDGELLGLGGQKIVRAKILETGQCVAIMHSRDPMHALDNERQKMEELRGFLHLLQLVDVPRPPGTIITEFARYGSIIDLYDHLEFRERRHEFTVAHVEEILAQTIMGLEELAALNLRHGDLAARNILVFEFGPVTETLIKLGDFGDTCEMHNGRIESTNSLRKELLEMCV